MSGIPAGNMGPLAIGADLDALVTGRRESFLAGDWNRHAEAIAAAIVGRRILIVGGAGSIGRDVVKLISLFRPRAIHVIDFNENALAELARTLRNRPEGPHIDDFRALPIDFGNAIAERYLADAAPYDAVLNFAAIKHVRSEKDLYSVLQMLETNVVKQARFKNWLSRYGHDACYFAVSTDKAANPASLMGASKRLMEDLVFAAPSRRVVATRFANVAFSSGSLLESFMLRFGHRQPLAAPRHVSRYFVTRLEAAQTCVLAAFAGPDGHVLIPDFDPNQNLVPLADLAAAIIRHFGLEPAIVEDEAVARNSVEAELRRGRYPLLLTPSDTSGEKPFEEFVGDDETVQPTVFRRLKAIPRRPGGTGVSETVQALESIVGDPAQPIEKSQLVEILRRAVPTLRHIETERDLDQRM